MAIYLKQKELGELVGRTDRQIRNIDNAAPADQKLLVKAPEKEAGYDACIFVRRWCDMLVDKAKESLQGLEAVKARHEIVKTEKTQLEVAKMRREVLDFRDVRRAWLDVANNTMQAMLNIPARVAPLIHGNEDTETIRNLIDAEIRAALENIADTPLPDYAMELTEDEENEEND